MASLGVLRTFGLAIGQHHDEIYRRVGYTEQLCQAFRNRGII
jgi:hypothetical protein